MSNPSASRSTSADGSDFRNLLGCFATGVTVATTGAPGTQPIGMTASSVASVSLEPPLLLVCVNQEAKLHEALKAKSGFALNVLAADQEGLSSRFANTDGDPFDGVAYSIDPNGLPLLHGVVAHIRCAWWGEYPAGDHTVFFGRVEGGATFDKPPLARYRRHYAAVVRNEPA